MIRLIDVHILKPYELVCKFNNGDERLLHVLPIINQQLHIEGVSDLLNEKNFANVEVGELGEITWRKIVKTKNNGIVEFWDYDISPEFAFYNSVEFNSIKTA